MVRKYNKVVADIKAELPPKTNWLVQVRLIDNTELGLEYDAYSKLDVKSKYDMDVRVYNGLIVGQGASKRYIKRKDIDRVLDIIMVDGSVSEDEMEELEELE